MLQESKAIFTQIKTILEGKASVTLFSEFLRRNNKTDLIVLKTTKVGPQNTMATSQQGAYTGAYLGKTRVSLFDVPHGPHPSKCFYALGDDF